MGAGVGAADARAAVVALLARVRLDDAIAADGVNSRECWQCQTANAQRGNKGEREQVKSGTRKVHHGNPSAVTAARYRPVAAFVNVTIVLLEWSDHVDHLTQQKN